MATDGTERDGTLVEVHENIGKEGVIVELRPEEHDTPAERDMEHLSESEAQDLYQQLGSYLRDSTAECDCPYCQDGEMYRDGPKVVCDNCGEVKLA